NISKIFESKHLNVCKLFHSFEKRLHWHGKPYPRLRPKSKVFRKLSTSKRFKMDLVLFSKTVLNNLVQGSHFKSRKCFFTQTFQVSRTGRACWGGLSGLGNFQ